MLYLNKVVLVTGSSRGVGREIAVHFLEQGAKVIGMSRGNGSIDDEMYTHFEVDLSQAKLIPEVFFEIRKKFTEIHIVINNAGVLTSQYSMIMPPMAAQQMVNVNLLAPFLVSRESAKFMRKTK